MYDDPGGRTVLHVTGPQCLDLQPKGATGRVAWWAGPSKGGELVSYFGVHAEGAPLVDACMAVFWKLDSEAARTRFHASLGAWHMAVRRVAGQDKKLSIVVLSARDYYRIADDVQVDVVEFQRLREKAMATRDAVAAVDFHIEAASQVRGTLLAGGADYLWSATLRADFERDVLLNLARMERLLSELGPSWQGSEAMERMLKVDPTMESVSRRLMQAYAALGHPELAQREYARLTKTLQDELRKPSSATSRVYQQIRRQHRLP